MITITTTTIIIIIIVTMIIMIGWTKLALHRGD